MYKYKSILFTIILGLSLGHLVLAQNLSSTWEVQKYDLTVNLPQNYDVDRDLDVTAKLSLKNISQRSYSRLTLRISDQANISSVKVNNSTADFRKGEEPIGGNRKLQRAIVNLPSIPPNGTYAVTVNYKLNVKDNSGLKSLSPINSQFLPLSFWYPTPNSWYFAGGSDFAPTNLQINGLSNLQAVAAGTQNGNSFENKLNGQPFFVVRNWQKISANGVEVLIPKMSNSAINARANELATLASEANSYISQLFGTNTNYPLKIVSVSRGAGFSDSGTVFITDSVFHRSKIDSQTAFNIAEGIAKTFLGNIKKVKGVGYGVIREGLARYIATEFIEKKYGKDIADIERLRQRTSYSTIINRDIPLNTASPVDQYYYTANANKGSVIWKYLNKQIGSEQFYKSLKAISEDGDLTLNEVQTVFSVEKDYLDYTLTKVTDMNLLVGIPQKKGGSTSVALRNLGEIPVTVDIVATLSNGQKVTSKTTIDAKSFGSATFNTQSEVVRVEVDPDKIYPQINYLDDIAPRAIDESDPLVFIKRDFDRQKYVDAERKAQIVNTIFPKFDDAKILLARSLLAQNKITEAKRVYEEVLKQDLPTARSIAWAKVGLGEIAQKTGQNSQAIKYFEDAIKSDAEYGATLAARNGRNKTNNSGQVSPEIKNFFADFDKAVVANSKSQIDKLILNGEVSRFASNIAGQAQEWTTEIKHTDQIKENTILVETNLNIKLLNRNNENGIAVFRLSKISNQWKLSGVDIFEVR